jgi:hypothetical protein
VKELCCRGIRNKEFGIREEEFSSPANPSNPVNPGSGVL